MKTLWYVYPMNHLVSFKFVAENHIAQLKKKFKVQEIDENGFLNIYPYSSPTTIIHPLLYITGKDFEKFAHVRSKMSCVVGVEVADSDRVSWKAVSLCNLCDALIVPSTFAKKSYVNSGVNVPVHIVPHGLGKHFYRSRVEPENSKLKLVKKMKEKKGYVYLLFFLWHSGYRKGVDLVYRVVREVQRNRDNVVLILKSSNLTIGAGLKFDEDKTILVSGWLSDNDVVALYDMSDIYLLFSRGGGFELNGLEALARGNIVLAPEYGSWVDYLPKEDRLPVAKWVKVLPGNEYHIGLGPEIDVNKAVDKLLYIIDNLDEWKKKHLKYAKEIRKKYSWDKVGEKLIKVMNIYV